MITVPYILKKLYFKNNISSNPEKQFQNLNSSISFSLNVYLYVLHLHVRIFVVIIQYTLIFLPLLLIYFNTIIVINNNY